MMGKLNFVINGVLRLPHGFRFHPTDEELVVQYLGRKVLAWPLPASIIPEVMITKQILGTCQNHVVAVENWVLCRIFLKKRSGGATKNEDGSLQSSNEKGVGKARRKSPVFYEFLSKERTNLNPAPTSSSSCSSGITRVSNNDTDDHEESSSCNSFPYFRRKP
uniref:NAC domain-containing protein n=1 Tax=Gossypium raimondii TaxID=29730 RepID=A0A0D2NEI0_GOSRA|nr:hypothetical protein B456_005G195400 [Gossypium raimondii]